MQEDTSAMSEFKILFVDNSRTTRATMQRIFEKQGFNVESAASGAEAIEKVQLGDYNLVVMDLFMPMMNGYEAAKKIRELPEEDKRSVPIVALTASSDEKDVDIAKDAGMDDFVVKSTDHKDLFEVLNKYKDAAN